MTVAIDSLTSNVDSLQVALEPGGPSDEIARLGRAAMVRARTRIELVLPEQNELRSGVTGYESSERDADALVHYQPIALAPAG